MCKVSDKKSGVRSVGPLLAPYAPSAFVSEEVFATTSRGFWFGSDFLGRDVLNRLLVGARFTVGLSAVAVALTAAIGTDLAPTAAVGPRWLDEFLSRAMDTLISIPSKIFALRPGWLADETAQVMAPLAHIAEQPDLCRFLPRFPVAIPGRCDVAAPPLRTMAAGNVVLCHRSEAELAGLVALPSA